MNGSASSVDKVDAPVSEALSSQEAWRDLGDKTNQGLSYAARDYTQPEHKGKSLLRVLPKRRCANFPPLINEFSVNVNEQL
ncbi:unnamed protein product [Clonostachys rosea f. rosea IK726]|uniref:Uncharacterized protein n=1 Tax=Clonostachys rosea f. rosea IK726 TaxID=1349383 RepID=A0ACA9TX56_BIOOC|nr:unnamed protein product [Clonostachys rosea f. rosea IK726]